MVRRAPWFTSDVRQPTHIGISQIGPAFLLAKSERKSKRVITMHKMRTHSLFNGVCPAYSSRHKTSIHTALSHHSNTSRQAKINFPSRHRSLRRNAPFAHSIAPAASPSSTPTACIAPATPLRTSCHAIRNALNA